MCGGVVVDQRRCCCRPTLFLLLIISINLSTVTSARRNFFHNKPASQQQQQQLDPYKVLGLKYTASNDDIQKAYRKKARETHRKLYIDSSCWYILRHMICSY